MKQATYSTTVLTRKGNGGELCPEASAQAFHQADHKQAVDVVCEGTELIVPYHAQDAVIMSTEYEEVERPEDPMCVESGGGSNTFTVFFINCDEVLESAEVSKGGSATYTGETPTKTCDEHPENFVFIGWTPEPTNITSDTVCVATYKDLTEFDDAEITDDWATILANIENGTYLTKYSLGNYKPLDLGTEGIVNMQIVAFDSDELADGSGKAPISWISKELLATLCRYNPARSPSSPPYDEGTGGVGGWEKSEIRSYMSNTIKPLIPSNVSSAIKSVSKYSYTVDTSGASGGAYTNIQTTDDVWIPSYHELNFGNKETQGPVYSLAFPNSSSRIKRLNGDAKTWWTRSAYSGTNCYQASNAGSDTNFTSTASCGIALGFCL